jgi:nicotinate-nucleotide--dimethylbenzimidazole phosphoribosyltransferase
VSAAAARARLDQLTMPHGALGALEDAIVQLAAIQNRERPSLERVAIAVFAGDHGVSEEGVSAYPAEVTVQMLHGLAGGTAAIAVLARALGTSLEVIDVGSRWDGPPLPGVIDKRVVRGTANLRVADALTPAQAQAAWDVGAAWVPEADLIIPGEIGIGNSTAAAALAAFLLDAPAQALTGRGTGLDEAGLARKTQVVADALARASGAHAVGGAELFAMAGAMAQAAARRIPVLVDGFIATAAALLAISRVPITRDVLLFGHRSAEQGHGLMLDQLGATPLLNLGLRLGEGTGAALALPVLRLACTLHADMLTFAQAGVSSKAS